MNMSTFASNLGKRIAVVMSIATFVLAVGFGAVVESDAASAGPSSGCEQSHAQSQAQIHAGGGGGGALATRR